MRVCFFCHVVTLHARGGMQYDLDIRAEWLLSRGHEVEVITTGHASLPPSHARAGVQYHFLENTRPTRPTMVWRRASIRKFLHLHQVRPFDLVISMGGGGWQYVQLRARRPELPPAVLMAQMPIWQLLDHLLRRPTPINLAKALRHAYNWLRWHRPYGRQFAAVVVLSDFTKAFALAEGCYQPSRIHVVANGINTDEFCPGSATAALRRRLQLNPDDKVALWVGRFLRYKGWLEALEASAEVAARIPDYRLVLIAGGVGPQRARFWRAVERLGLERHVRLAEDVDRRDLPDYYRLGDCLVAPFHGPEAQPWVLLESMACGVPVVASDLPELRAFVRDQLDGRVVPLRPRRAFAEAIATLLSQSGAEQQALAARVRQRAVDCFDAGRSARETIQLLEAVAGYPVLNVEAG